MSAIALAILTALPQITVGVDHLFAWLVEFRAMRNQTSEWTSEMENLFISELIRRATSSAYLPDRK